MDIHSEYSVSKSTESFLRRKNNSYKPESYFMAKRSDTYLPAATQEMVSNMYKKPDPLEIKTTDSLTKNNANAYMEKRVDPVLKRNVKKPDPLLKRNVITPEPLYKRNVKTPEPIVHKKCKTNSYMPKRPAPLPHKATAYTPQRPEPLAKKQTAVPSIGKKSAPLANITPSTPKRPSPPTSKNNGGASLPSRRFKRATAGLCMTLLQKKLINKEG